MKKNILVFPIDGLNGSSIMDNFKNHKHFNMIGASSKEHFNTIKLPFVTAHDFMEKLEKIILNYKIDYIIPCIDSICEILLNSKYHDLLICQPLDIFNSIYNKKNFESIMITLLPEYYPKIENNERCIYVKPIFGSGQKGHFILDGLKSVKNYSKKYIFQKKLSGDEFTIDCFSEKGKSVLFSIRKRVNVENGVCIFNQIIENNIFNKLLLDVQKVFQFDGYWFIQVKEHEGRLFVLEIGGRFSSNWETALVTGNNFVELALYKKMGANLTYIKNMVTSILNTEVIKHTIFRLSKLVFNNVYIDIDDTLIVNGQVNPDIVSFIVECKNAGKEIFAITNGNTKIPKYCNSLFTDFIKLDTNQCKALFMYSSSLLIDDSFHQRKEAIERGYLALHPCVVGKIKLS